MVYERDSPVVLMPVTGRSSDYFICFDLSSGFRAHSDPNRGVSTVFTNYPPYAAPSRQLPLDRSLPCRVVSAYCLRFAA